MEDEPPRIERAPDGDILIGLSWPERDMLRTWIDGYDKIVAEGAPGTERLYPPAYPDDPEAENQFRGLVRNELVDGRRANRAIVGRTLDADRLDPTEAHAWLAVANDLRLVLGTRLEVTETLDGLPPEDDPAYPTWIEYLYLGWLASQLVDALASGLDE